MPDVTVYTRDYCPFCTRALSLLKKRGVEPTVYNASENPAYRQQMIERANGRSTFPQIFIGTHHVGGCDDLMELDFGGELDDLLKG